MVLSFSQPAFIPWGGFFARLRASDVMVLLDNTLFAQGFTFVNRNRLKGTGGELWITIPVKKSKRGRQKIKNLEIHEKEYWALKWLCTLKHTYGKSVHFDRLNKKIVKILKGRSFLFIDTVYPLLEMIRSELQISARFVFQSQLGIESGGVQLLLDISKKMGAKEVVLPYFSQNVIGRDRFEEGGISVKLLKFLSPEYPQFWGGFKKNLSILDMLFCMGKESNKIIKKGTAFASLRDTEK